jgi:hypothetical protein
MDEEKVNALFGMMIGDQTDRYWWRVDGRFETCERRWVEDC